jgi:hypothetical protein
MHVPRGHINWGWASLLLPPCLGLQNMTPINCVSLLNQHLTVFLVLPGCVCLSPRSPSLGLNLSRCFCICLSVLISWHLVVSPLLLPFCMRLILCRWLCLVVLPSFHSLCATLSPCLPVSTSVSQTPSCHHSAVSHSHINPCA